MNRVLTSLFIQKVSIHKKVTLQAITHRDLRFMFYAMCFFILKFLMICFSLIYPLAVNAQSSDLFTVVWFDDVIDTTYSIAWGDYDGDGDLDLVVGNYYEANRLYRNDGGFFVEVSNALAAEDDYTYSVAWGDYDGDGDLDLAVGNDGGVNRLYHNDNGIFTEIAGALGMAAEHTCSVIWGDYDSDGDLDLIVGNNGQPNRLYRNDDGVFHEVIGALSAMTDFMAWGDYDGDGDLDLAVGIDGSRNRLYRNDDGVFHEIVGALGAEYDYTRSIAWGDYDGDLDLDLVVGNWAQVNRLYRNDDGMFIEVAGALGTVADVTESVIWGDYDGDGDLDLAVGNQGLNRLYRNDNGIFVEVIGALGIATDHTYSMAWGDYDSDGDLDLFVGNSVQLNYLYRNDSGILIGDVDTLDTLGNVESIAWGDYDSDGDLDLAIGRHGVDLLYRNDSGSFVEVTGALGTSTDNTYSVAWGDYDSDGDLDLAVGGQVSRLYRNDSGSFVEVTGVLGMAATSVAWGDYDSDGDLDLAMGRHGVILYRNDIGSFVEVTGTLGTSTDNTYSVAWGDYDGDSDLDLAVGNYAQWQDGQYVRGGAYLYRNDGGTFSEVIGALGKVTDPTSSVAWGDYDGDGDLDLVIGNSGDPAQVNRLYRNSGGTFNEVVGALGAVAEDTSSLAWGDYDGDGDLDLALGTYYGVNRLYRNDGGMFIEVTSTLVTVADGTSSVAWGDCNGDGDLDLAIGNYSRFNFLYHNGQQGGQMLVDDMSTLQVGGVYNYTANHYAAANILKSFTIPITYTLFDPEGDPVGRIEAFYSPNGGGHWLPAVATTDTLTMHLSTSPWPTATITNTHVYTWDTFTSNFFGQSDNVVFRMVAYPQPATAAVTGTYKYYNSTPLFQRPYASATTFPFRVRGTQVRVFSETIASGNEAASALVYRWNEGAGSTLMSNSAGIPFRTDSHGYLQGRGQIGLGDQLLAMLPVSTVAEYAGALTFDGLGDYAIKNPFNNAPITETTVAFWINTTQDTAGTPFSYAVSGQDNELLIFNVNNLTLYRGGVAVSTGVTVTDGNWHHIAFTWRDVDDRAVLYKDGKLAYSGILTATTIVPGGSLVLGQEQDNLGGGFENTQAFEGMLDEVCVWNIVLSESQILDELVGLHNHSHLVACWSFDNPDTPGADASGNDNALTLYGATWDGDYLGGYTVYHTNGSPTATGVDAFPVTQAGVQTITVSAAHPLMLFDLNVSLEWDAHNDPLYLQQLEADLKKASAYLYDFTDGQVALGKITVYQNADAWGTAHIAVQATNRLRPFAHIGGLLTEIVTETVTVGGQEHTLTYGPGQIRMGATWNRYGDPAQSIGVDWPLILAHELSHYLLYQYDVYLGFNADGLLIPVDTCILSAMGDVYAIDNTEFIADPLHWTSACSETLAAKTLGRTEWETLRAHYPWLITPTGANEGPTQMPFDFTTVEVLAPTQAQNLLEHPVFYLDYADGVVSSSAARAFLLRDADDAALPGPDDFEFIYDLGNPIGGQNRVLARGAQPGDRLCVFDSARAQFGCEIIAAGDERLTLRQDTTWTPIIQLSPVNSTTFDIQITGLVSADLQINARVYPEYGAAFTTTTLSYFPPEAGEDEGTYSSALALDYPAMSGHVQVWVDEDVELTEIYSRREIIVGYAIGGNPGPSRPGGIGPSRPGGIGPSRPGGIGPSRPGGIGLLQTAEAPVVSPDGQMILYLSNVITFAEGQFYTIQAMAGLPSLPPGRTPVGPAYNLVATGFLTDTPPLTGSVSIQYLGSDALAAGVDERDLCLYFWDGIEWEELQTELNTTYNMASAHSQGTGIYALLASVRLSLYGPGWNLIAYPLRDTQTVTQALLSISGTYTTVYGYKADDLDDPWRVYDVTVPEPFRPVVNDLTTLEFGKGYWINVSQAITLYLSNVAALTTPMHPENVIPTAPPDTFYGVLLGNTSFAPGAGMPIEARIRETVCGRDIARVWGDHVVYVVDVHSSALAGCGHPGDTVTFFVAGQPMVPTAVWDNAQLNEITLRPASRVYLPLVLRAK